MSGEAITAEKYQLMELLQQYPVAREKSFRVIRVVVGSTLHHGANVTVVKTMYLAYTRSLIIYAAPLLPLVLDASLEGFRKYTINL